jgi:hypothetical protein
MDIKAKSAEVARVLEVESGLMVEALEAHKRFRDAVLAHSWKEAARTTGALEAVAVRLADAEKQRGLVMEGIGDFYEGAAVLPLEEREMVCGLYRGLKSGATRLGIAQRALLEYTAEMGEAMRGMLDAAFPARRAKTYGRSGALRSGAVSSMVLNRQA